MLDFKFVDFISCRDCRKCLKCLGKASKAKYIEERSKVLRCRNCTSLSEYNKTKAGDG